MLCEKCGQNTATTHIKTVINGDITEMKLCGYCAAKEGYTDFQKGSLSALLSSMLTGGLQNPGKIQASRCSFCGATFAQIAEIGKVGCSNCYKEFKSELLPYFKRIHGSVQHNGKTPVSTQKLATVPEKPSIEELKIKLAELVASERYEEAAVLRDKIKEEEGKK